jgi:hypothetical protein
MADFSDKGSDVAGRILLSPLTDNKRPFPHWFGDQGAIDSAMIKARAAVDAGRGTEIIPLPMWFYGISAAALIQRCAEPDDFWMTQMAKSDSPILCVAGGMESRVNQWRTLVESLPARRKRFSVTRGVDHLYGGAEQHVADTVLEFVLDEARRPY